MIQGNVGKLWGSEGEVFSRTRHVRAGAPCECSVRVYRTLHSKVRIKKAALSLEFTSPSFFSSFKRVCRHAASNHTSFAGGERKEMTCEFFVLHRCILLPCSRQSRWSGQRARAHERAHAPPARADTHTRQTPASMQRAVQRRGPRLIFW